MRTMYTPSPARQAYTNRASPPSIVPNATYLKTAMLKVNVRNPVRNSGRFATTNTPAVVAAAFPSPESGKQGETVSDDGEGSHE